MATAQEILTSIDPKAPYALVIEASVRDYCVLALQFLKKEADPGKYFAQPLPNPLPALDQEASARQHSRERYCIQLYNPAEEALLADAIADIAFAQSQRLMLAEPASPQADDRERACVYITAVYTLFALELHGRTDFAVLFLEAWANFNEFASARTVRMHYDRSWNSRYEALFYPLG